MASPYTYKNTGGIVGARLATRREILSSGQRWYVHNSGSDAYNGRERHKPLATLSAAHTAAAAGDTIQIMEGHVEALAAAQTFNKARLHVYGEGAGSTAPRFTAAGAVAMFDVTAAGLVFENIYFPASTSAPTARVRVASAYVQLVSCTVESGAVDTNAAVQFITGASQGRVVGCEFRSVATAVTAQPDTGLEVVNAMTDLELDRVVFDGGSFGWSDFAFKGAAAITALFAYDVKLLNDSDALFVTGTSGRFHVSDTSGSARVQWDA